MKMVKDCMMNRLHTGISIVITSAAEQKKIQNAPFTIRHFIELDSGYTLRLILESTGTH